MKIRIRLDGDTECVLCGGPIEHGMTTFTPIGIKCSKCTELDNRIQKAVMMPKVDKVGGKS